MKTMVLLNCALCGCDLLRDKMRKYATCFECKRNRMKAYTKRKLYTIYSLSVVEETIEKEEEKC